MTTQGIGHVEVILAFVLFIGFLGFGLYFFNPLSSTRVLDSSLFYAADAVADNVTAPLLSYGVSFNQTDSFSLPDEVQFSLSREQIPGRGISVETPDQTRLASSYEGNVVSVARSSAEFFYVRFGEFSSENAAIAHPAVIYPGANYTISSSERRDVFSETRLLALNQSYYEHYDDVRTFFNLPRRVDFAVTVTFSPNDVISMTRPVPEGFDVLSQVERKEIVRADGRISFADVGVQVW